MVAEPGVQEFVAWEENPTTVRAVDRALSELWHNARHQETPDGRPAPVVTRTSVMNLIVYASSRGVAERAISAINHLSGTHPSRSLFILAIPGDASGSLGASLRGLCRDQGQGRRLCFEQIEITAEGTTVAHLPGIITQLTIHDLPTLLWWPGDPPLADPFFAEMAAVCDSVVVDSSDFVDPEVELWSMAQFALGHRQRAAINDLNWDRLTDWRELIAQFFDAAAMQVVLPRLQQVRIEYAFDAGGQRNSAQGLLLAGWLASRLGWELEWAERESAAVYVLHLRGTHGSVEVRISALPGRHAAPGSVTGLVMTSASPARHARFAIRLDEEGDQVTASVELDGGKPILRTIHLEAREESALLSAEIEAVGRERAYEDALPVAGIFAQPLRSGVPFYAVEGG